MVGMTGITRDRFIYLASWATGSNQVEVLKYAVEAA